MYTLTVSDHCMVAHSFRGEEFGPAQRTHGATFVAEAEFRAPRLAEGSNLLVDIGLARAELRRALDTFDYRDLDGLPQFEGLNTTTEFLCAHLHGLLAAALRGGRLGPHGAGVSSLKVTLRESPVAWASYEAAVAGDGGA